MEPVKEDQLLTDTEREQLREYLVRMDELKARKPKRIEETVSEKEYNAAVEYLLRGKGERPPCADRFTVTELKDPTTGGTLTGIYDTEWEAWNQELIALNKEYQETIVKVLTLNFDSLNNEQPQSVISIIDSTIENADTAFPVMPKRYIIPNNPLSNSLVGRPGENGELLPIINEGEFDLRVIPANKSGKGEVTAYTVITMEENGNDIILKGRKYTEYDRCVMNGIVSLWETGNTFITPEMVYRTMNNKTSTETVSPAQKGAVTRSIEKMRVIKAYCNTTAEFAKRKITDPDGNPIEWIIDDFLLVARGHNAKVGGKWKKGYELKEEPILLTYSKYTGQLLSANMKLLDIKRVDESGHIHETIPTTEARQQIKEYLLRRILIMKHDRKNKKPRQDHHIKFDTLYMQVDINPANKTETKRARDYTFQVLDYWTAVKDIAGYEIETHGRKVYSVLIKFNT